MNAVENADMVMKRGRKEKNWPKVFNVPTSGKIECLGFGQLEWIIKCDNNKNALC